MVCVRDRMNGYQKKKPDHLVRFFWCRGRDSNPHDIATGGF
jgi:hypothetical protein